MKYEELLELPPFGVPQVEKELYLAEMLRKLTEYHRKHCEKYGRFVELTGKLWRNVAEEEKIEKGNLTEIPALPVSVFKEETLQSVPEKQMKKTVTSSGTSGQTVSKVSLDRETSMRQQMTLCRIMEEVVGKKRLPMLILDSEAVLKDRRTFSARGAGILGFFMMSSSRCFALDEEMKLRIDKVETFLEQHPGPILLFGFTYMVWEYFVQELRKRNTHLTIPEGILIHGGGWKKIQKQAVSEAVFHAGIREVCETTKVYDYYGMAEQAGAVYLECEEGYLHASTYSDVIIRRAEDFSECEIGENGLIQVLSPLATSYPGHSILTEDQGILLGIDDCPCGRKGKYFKITGRAKKAEIRGCSDTYDKK